MYDLFSFYRSKEWEDFRKVILAERIQDDGFVHDEITGEPIVKAYDIILHHKIELTEENVNDFNISLNPANIQVVSHRTHNALHDRFGANVRQVFLVYGSPFAGKRDFVLGAMSEGDMILDIDSIWECVSGCERYVKPKRLNAVVFKIRDEMMDAIKYRLGQWHNAYIIGGYPLTGERERICKEVGAREIFIDTPKEECLVRLGAQNMRERMKWQIFIDEWFDRYQITNA